MVYVDTSVLVPLFLNEAHSAAAATWYSSEKTELVLARNARRLKIKPVALCDSALWR